MSLLLDALRKAEKVKEAQAAGEPGDAADIPMLVEEARKAETDDHGLALVDLSDVAEVPEGGGEHALVSTGSPTRAATGHYESLDPVAPEARAGNRHSAAGGARPELTLGSGEARSLFDLNGESAYQRRWRWGFIGTGLVLIVGLCVYYGWLLYVAVKPSAGLVPRELPALAFESTAPATLASLQPPEASARDALEEPPAAVSRAERDAPPEAPKPRETLMVPSTGGIESKADAPFPRLAKAAPSKPAQSRTEGRTSGATPGEDADVAARATSRKSIVSGRSMTITRTRRQDPVFPRLAKAYRAYRAGHHAQAEADYRWVLEHDPDNRDALLGVAAIAVSQGRTDQAFKNYRRVLANSPGDQVALAALTSMQENGDPLQTENRLKRLLAAEPDAAYLHFSLGNLYAAQGRWREAQQAYFDAYRRDSGNGDYAYNLAVGLDHLGQQREALRYYRQALEVAGREQVRFEPETVRRRVGTLSERTDASAP